MELAFNSLNPYQEINQITGRSPDELVQLIRSISQPIKILSIVGNNGRYTCFFCGDVKIKKQKSKGDL